MSLFTTHPNNNNIFKGMNSGVFMRFSLKRKDKEIRPYVLRFDCPFYEFTNLFDAMIDFRDNQCGLKSGLYGNPCQMKNAGDKPNWSRCPFNTEKNRKKIEGDLEKIRVFPREFRPQKAKSWDGIPLEIWMRHIEDVAIEE